MQYPQFLESLFDNGRVTVPDPARLTANEIDAGGKVIAEFECQYRLDMPGEAPCFCPDAAQWAGIKFFQACQFAVFRDLGEDVLNKTLSEPLAKEMSPSVCYSVDIVFRYLPSLVKFASSAASRDPLLEHLLKCSRDWPLSSVGMSEVGDVVIDPFAENPSLLQLYVDRIIAAEDVARLADPRVREGVRSALGVFGNLKSGIEAALANYENKEKAE
ncbi:MAG: hypothetical protein PVH19_06795 [Planctomycetia bacterium]|jgi:hypothetical protein